MAGGLVLGPWVTLLPYSQGVGIPRSEATLCVNPQPSPLGDDLHAWTAGNRARTIEQTVQQAHVFNITYASGVAEHSIQAAGCSCGSLSCSGPLAIGTRVVQFQRGEGREGDTAVCQLECTIT